MSDTTVSNLGPEDGVHRFDNLVALDEFCHSHNTVLLSITHPLAPSCKRFAPVFQEPKVATALSGYPSPVPCVEIPTVFGLRIDIRGFPTLVICHGAKKWKKYHGPLKELDILAFVKRDSRSDPVQKISTTAELSHELETQPIVIIGYVNDDDYITLKSFTSVAKDLQDSFSFVTVPKTSQSIAVYTNGQPYPSHLEPPLTPERIQTFLSTATRPFIMQLLPELHYNLLQKQLPLGYIFTSPSFDTSSILDIAKKYHSQIQLLTVDPTIVTDLPDTMNLGSPDFPAFAIHSPPRNKKYPLIAPFSPTAVDDFINAFLSDKLKPSIKSAPVPIQKGPIVEVVGSTYDDIILGETKDVLVEFYTPWCGPCKALLPEYEKLADFYRGSDKVVIAKLDCESNDVPDGDIRGFPWFKLYRAGRKYEPVTYSGERRVDAWRRFIEGGN
ncbi:hypothetical protein OQA88_1087 [Cercophora sp. LCS_1]